MVLVKQWLSERFWRIPLWVWLLGLLVMSAAGWWQFVVPKPAPLAAPTAAPALALEGTPIPQPQAAITPANAAQVVQFAQFGEDTPRLVAVSPNGRWMAAGSSSGMAIYDTQTLSRTALLDTPFRIGVYQYSNLAIASDGATVAAIDGLYLWLRPANGDARLVTSDGNTSDDGFTSLVFSPDGTMLAASAGQDIRLFRASDGALLRSYKKNRGNERVLTFSPDGAWLLTYSGERVLIREIRSWWNPWPHANVTSLDTDVSAAAFSHDGTQLAVGTENGRVALRSFERGLLGDTRTVMNGMSSISSVAFAPDDHSLAIGALGNVMRLVNIPELGQTPRETTLLAHTRPLSATLIAAFAPDSTLATVALEPYGTAPFASAGRATLRRWRTNGEQLGEHVWGLQPAPAIRFTADEATTPFTLDYQTTQLGGSTYLMLGAGTPRLWQISAGIPPPLPEPGVRIIGGDLSGDGAMMAVVAANGTDVYLVRVADGALSQTIGNGLPVKHIVWMPDSATILLEDRHNTTLWNARDGTVIRTIAGEYAALAPNGALLAMKRDQRLSVWQINDGAIRYTVDVAASWINDAAFSPNGEMLAVGDRDGTVSLVNADTGTLLRRLPRQGEYISACTFTPDNATLACRANDDTVRLWSVANGTLLYALNTPGKSIDSFQIAPNGAILATASHTDSVRLWRIADGTLQQTIDDQNASIRFSADSTRMFTGYELVREWQIADGTKLRERISPAALSYSTPSPDGTLRLSAGIGVWRVADGAVVGPFTEPFGERVFAPDGQTFVTTESGGVAKLRRSANGVLLHTLQAPNYNGYMDAAVFAPDSATVAVGTREGNVHIWRVADGTLSQTLAVSEEAGGFFRDIESLVYAPDGQLLAVGTSRGRIFL